MHILFPTNIQLGDAKLLLCSGYGEEIAAALRSGERAADSFMGRSRVRSVPIDGRRMVVRRYAHGGLFGRFLGDVFISPRRAAREVEVARRALEKGVPTAVPIGVRLQRALGLFFRMDLLSEEIAGARALPEALLTAARNAKPSKGEIIRAVGAALRRLHDAGIYHADLQVRNIVLDDAGRAYIIDLDKAKLKERLSFAERLSNLRRLHRSAVKVGLIPSVISNMDVLRFIKAYADGDSTMLARLMRDFRARMPRYTIHRFFWRTGSVERNLRTERRATVSACIVTFNEEENIEDCLKSVSWADEIIVVDSFSSDATLDIARRYTDRIYQREWRGINDQRNFAASKATCDWILSIDADERVTPYLREEIERELSRPDCPYDGFYVRRKNFYLGRWMRFGGWYPEYRLRLFRRGQGRFVGMEPHDKIVCDGRTKKLKGELLHFSFKSLADQMERSNRYSTIQAQELLRRGCRLVLPRMVLCPIGDFVRAYILKLGFLDGVQGLISAVMLAFHVFLKYAKVRELQKQR